MRKGFDVRARVTAQPSADGFAGPSAALDSTGLCARPGPSHVYSQPPRPAISMPHPTHASFRSGGAGCGARSTGCASRGTRPHAFFARVLNTGPGLESGNQLLGAAISGKLDEGCLRHGNCFDSNPDSCRRCSRIALLRQVSDRQSRSAVPTQPTTPQRTRMSSIHRRGHSQVARNSRDGMALERHAP